MIQVAGDQDELYSRAEMWFAKTFIDANEVLQVEDKEGGKLVGKGSIRYAPTDWRSTAVIGDVSYVINIFIKDGRYKYEIINFIHKASSRHQNPLSLGLITSGNYSIDHGHKAGNKLAAQKWEEVKRLITPTMAILIESLKDSMSKPTETENDDW